MKILKRIFLYFFVLVFLYFLLLNVLAQTQKVKEQETKIKYICIPLVDVMQFANYNCDWYKINYPQYTFATYINDSVLINHHYFDDLLIIAKPKDFFKPIILNNTRLLFYVKDYLNNNNLNIKIDIYNNKDKEINWDLFIVKSDIDNLLLNQGFIPGERQEYPRYKVLLVSIYGDNINCIIEKNKRFEKIVLNRNYNSLLSFLNNLLERQ